MKKILAIGVAVAALAVIGDELLIHTKERYVVDSSAADFVTRTNELNTVDITRLETAGVIEFNLGEGVEVTIRKPITGQVNNKSTNADLVKKGPGRLNLYSPWVNGAEYYLAFDVQAGSVFLPDAYTANKSLLIRNLNVAGGASFTSQNVGTLNIVDLTGNGTVTVLCGATVTGSGRFDGVFTCSNQVLVRGRLALTNPDNNLPGGVNAYHVYATDTSIFEFASPESISGSTDMRTENWGGRLVYIGEGGDTVPHRIDIRNTKKDEFALNNGTTLDAGANGGATFTGGMRFAYGGYLYPTGTPGVWPFYLDGSNTLNEAVFSGKMQEGRTVEGPYVFKIVKRGTGIWHVKYNSSSTWTGPLAVENGTFRFDTIAEAGVNCALGFATNLYEATYTNIYTDCGYAVMLGATNAAGEATEGTLEYTGSARARVTTRPVAVRTKGRIKSSAGEFDLTGVSAKTDDGGAAVLALDGAAGSTNILRGVSDGNGTLSIVKDGAGDWTLAGEQDFSGSLSVNGGRLTLSNLNGHEYVYYRWLIKENGFASPIYIDRQTNGWSTAAAEVVIASIAGMNLYDSDGNGIMTAENMTAVLGGTETPATLAPGQVTYDKRFGTVIKDANINALPGLFDNLVTTLAGGNTSKVKFDAADSNSWVAIVWRMPAGAKRAVKFDYCQYYNAANSVGGRGIVNSELQASADGYSWDTVWSKTDAVINDSWKWISNPTGTGFKHEGDVSLNTHPGLDLDHTVAPTMATFHPGSGEVFVAPGAELMADGQFTVSNLCVSASGIGTFKGVTFAENGRVEIAELPIGVELPANFVDVSGLENLGNWAVYQNRTLRRRLRLKAGETGIIVCPPGVVMSFR